MPFFGAHLSTVGGVQNAALSAGELGFSTVQLFTKNNNQWKGKPLTDEQIQQFQRFVQKGKLKFPTAHDSYLINLGSPVEQNRQRSIEAFIDEIHRADQLGLSYLVMHPGAHMDAGESQGLKQIVASFDQILQECGAFQVKILLETSAGQGTSLGYRFEHLAAILAGVKHPEKFGVCVDTCHIFAAGYDISSPEGYHKTFEEFDRLVGLDRICLFHINDSKKPLGSRVDRHEHLGEGTIGKQGFQLLLRDSRFSNLPMILETPKTNSEGKPMDPVNHARMKRWLKG
ncbi:MAG: deoxyribonuclease IV [Gemmataceae bacterium]|nr:deoxyribonuclease IV [Gemmataceae bacterium]